MACQHWGTLDSLVDTFNDILENIQRYEFVAALRHFECANADKPRIGQASRYRDDIVRLSQHLSLAFEGRTLHSLSEHKAGTKAPGYRLSVNFNGLLGPNGPLPLHYAEYADQRARNHADPTFKEFIDVFNHRLLSLLYRANVQFDPAINFDRVNDNAYQDFIGAFCGRMPAASNDRDTLGEHAHRFYAGWMSNSRKTADGLSSILRDYFKLPVYIKQWVGAWLILPAESLARLGSSFDSNRLGHAMYIGRRVQSSRNKFCVQLGPVDWQTFKEFKAGSDKATRLHDLVRSYMGDEWDWDLDILLAANQVLPVRLNNTRSLGRDTWITANKQSIPREKTVSLNCKLLGYQKH